MPRLQISGLHRTLLPVGASVLMLAATSSGAQSPLRFGTSQPIDNELQGNFFALPTSADLDGDGDQDWVYTVGNYFSVRWLENQGGSPPVYVKHEISSFGSVVPMGRTPVIADIDNDGDLDVLVSGKKANENALPELSWYDQPADPINGTWKKRAIRVNSDYGFSFAENLNGDARPDVLSFSTGAGEAPYLRSFLNTASGAVEFSGPTTSFAINPPKKVVRTDLDGDSKPDYVFDGSNGPISLTRVEVEAGAPPTISSYDLAIPGEQFDGFAVGDLNGDGRPDVVYGVETVIDEIGYTDLYMRPNEYPSGTFGAGIQIARLGVTNFDVENIEIRDLDFDGRNDLFVKQGGGHIYVLPNSGGADAFARVIVPESPTVPNHEEMDLLDFDRDGDLDLVRSGAFLQWYPNDSSAYIREAALTQDYNEGFFTPGETGSLLVNLGNFAPHSVADVSVDLSASSSDFVPDSDVSTIGTLAKGGSRDLSIPFQINPSALCGSTLDVVLDVKVSGTTVDHYVLPIVLGELTEVETVAGASETPNAAIPEPVIVIPDPNPVAVPLTRTLTVTIPPGPIVSVVLDLNITHSYRGDLIVQLRSPEGTARTVFDGSVNDSGTSITGPFTVFGFEGEQAAGEYDLLVSDRVQGDTGTLVSWGVTVTATTQDCDIPAGIPAVAESILAIAEAQPSDDVNEDGVIDCADLIATN